MKKNIKEIKNRREFIRDCLRYGVGGGLVIISAIFGFRKSNPEENTGDCTLKNPCGGCSKYAGCNLPRAKGFRQNRTET